MLPLLLVCACGGGRDGEEGRDGGGARAEPSLTPIEQVAPHAGRLEDEPLDSAAVAEAMAAADAAEADAARSLREREASMAGREQCLSQAATLPPGPARQRVQESCTHRPSRPDWQR